MQADMIAANAKVTDAARSHRQRHIANAYEWTRRALAPDKPAGASAEAMLEAAHLEYVMAGGLRFDNQHRG